jgi:putative acetyltransferase
MTDILIRATEPRDAEALASMHAEPSCYANTLQLPYPSVQLWRQRLDHPPEGSTFLVAERNGRVVGQVGLHARQRERHVGAIGITVCEAERGTGVGSALMAAIIDVGENWLDLRRLELEVYVDNAAAIALYERHGFEREGIARQAAFRDGEYVDVIRMARLRR